MFIDNSSTLLSVMIFAISLLISGCSTPPSVQIQTRRIIFGIELNQESDRLLNHIEQIYGKNVREEIIPESLVPAIAEASISDDGTPIIRIKKSDKRIEESITHELHHLQLIAEGFPVISFDGDENVIKPYEKVLLILNRYIYDQIEHRIFFPKMREAGFSPDEIYKAEVNDILNKNHIEGPQIAITAFYFYHALNVKDHNLIDRLTSMYKKNHLDQPLEDGQKLLKIIEGYMPLTPESAAKAYQDCLNLLMGGKLKFHVSGWEVTKLGLLSQKTVTYAVTPTK